MQRLTQAGIAAENYPFCTIEPNVSIVEMPDARLAVLAAFAAHRARCDVIYFRFAV